MPDRPRIESRYVSYEFCSGRMRTSGASVDEKFTRMDAVMDTVSAQKKCAITLPAKRNRPRPGDIMLRIEPFEDAAVLAKRLAAVIAGLKQQALSISEAG